MSDDFIVTTTAVFGEVFGNLQRLRVYDAAEGELLLHGLSILSRECVAFLRVLLYHNAAQVGVQPSEAARVFVQHLELNKFRARYLAPFFHPHSGALAFYARYVNTLIQLDRSQHEVASARAAYWFVLNDESQLVLRSFACTETHTSQGADQCAKAVISKLREFQTKLSNVLQSNTLKLTNCMQQLASNSRILTDAERIARFNEIHNSFIKFVTHLVNLIHLLDGIVLSKEQKPIPEHIKEAVNDLPTLFSALPFDFWDQRKAFAKFAASVFEILRTCIEPPPVQLEILYKSKTLGGLVHATLAEVVLYYLNSVQKYPTRSAEFTKAVDDKRAQLLDTIASESNRLLVAIEYHESLAKILQQLEPIKIADTGNFEKNLAASEVPGKLQEYYELWNTHVKKLKGFYETMIGIKADGDTATLYYTYAEFMLDYKQSIPKELHSKYQLLLQEHFREQKLEIPS